MMRTKSIFFSILLVFSLAASLAAPAAADRPARVDVQILSLNDFHGALLPSTARIANPNPAQPYYVGGAAYLAARLNEAAATNPNTVKVSAGDLIGASPLLSAMFHDEPTIQA